MAIERKFSLMNFFYGLGAAVILIAALFKFVGWKHADVLFMVGLIGEAIIFLVAGLQPVPRYVEHRGGDPDVEPLISGQNSADAFEAKASNGTLDQSRLSNSPQEMNLMLNSLNEASRKLDELTEQYDVQNKEMEIRRSEYRKQIESVREHIETTRKRLNELERSKGL